MAEPFDFQELVRCSRLPLVRFLGRLVGEADAEDVAQIALSKAAAALGSFRGEATPRTWLYRIATNAARDWTRARGEVLAGREPLNEDTEDASLLDNDVSQERQLVREEMSRCVGEILRRLPESYQAVLALSDCEELSDKEMAGVLELPVGAAKIRLHRARARLKAELEGSCAFYRDENNVLCCDRKQESTPAPYRSSAGGSHEVERCTSGSAPRVPAEETLMTTSETLPAKQKHLIGVGAAIAAGCEPCTRSFVTAAREAGACERSVHLVIEKGLSGRQVATEEIASFAKNSFASPVLDAAFRAEKALLGALTQVAAAVASNAAHRVETTVESARALGATHNQILLAAQLGRTAKRGAERETDAALSRILGDAPMSVQSEGDGACGCASPCASGDGSVPGTAPQASSPKASTCGCH